jgi:hypothetical protein
MCAAGQVKQAVKPPTAAERQEMLAHLRASLDEAAEHMPDLVCRPASTPDASVAPQEPHDLGGLVVVDLTLPWRGKQDENKSSFTVEPLIRELSTSDAKFVFTGWTTLRRKQMAFYRYKGKSKNGIRQAEIYADRESGTLTQIVFHGLKTPRGAPIFCRTAHE